MSYIKANDCPNLLCFFCQDTGKFLYLNTPMCYGCWKKQMNAHFYSHEKKYTDEELQDFFSDYCIKYMKDPLVRMDFVNK